MSQAKRVGRIEVDKNYFDNGYLAIKEGKK
jgi:hypothetical protein